MLCCSRSGLCVAPDCRGFLFGCGYYVVGRVIGLKGGLYGVRGHVLEVF